ncbi:TAF5-like RNA polymerase II p300/CBP-associated factor-associated factor 65 kDa subunit 5L [Amphiura filiformis]|uniref:TAF5-like RNA polymerase II p300/CBP-associated factor-associated factor 65 kDa subunit 5L n=1 Tax=Amphiura filiformis TaxID=82378 RepID=UPI003B2225EE
MDLGKNVTMKRVNSEQIQAAVLQYLKRRNYIDTSADNFSKKSIKLTESLTSMAAQAAADREMGALNMVSCTTCEADGDVYEEQFNKLKCFIDESLEEYKSDLQGLLYPLFVHLFLEMIYGGHKSAAHSLYNKHHSVFIEMSEHSELVRSLTGVMNSMDLLTNPYLTAFRESKYVLSISKESLDYLMRYLQSQDTSVILKVLNLNIHMQVRGTFRNTDFQIDNEGPNNIPTTQQAPPTQDSSQAGSNDSVSELASLRETIEKVRQGPPTLPSILLYSLINAYQGLCCTNISQDSTLLIGGFEDASMKAWSLSPKKLKTARHHVDVSTVHLAGDCFDDIIREDSVGSESKVLRGHSGPVYGCSVSPDKNHIISCSEDTTVRSWNTSTYTNTCIYRGHNYPIWDVEFSPFGTYFATACKDHTARLWTLERTYPLRIFAGHITDVDCVRFHPNCKYLATGSSDKTVRLWNTLDGKCVRLFNNHRSTVLSLAFSNDGKYLASAGEDRRIKLWDLGMGSLFKELRGHTDIVHSLCFSPDSSMLASGGIDNSIRIWDVRHNFSNKQSESSASPELLSVYSTRSTNIQNIHFSKCNLLLAAGSQQS